MLILPMIGNRFSMFIAPADSFDKSRSMAEQIREQYNKIDESKVQKLDELILPSFKISASNFESVSYALDKDHLVSLAS